MTSNVSFINDWSNHRLLSHWKNHGQNQPQPGATATATSHTEPDIDHADRLLVRELNSMSMRERGQVYEEIHGVHQIINETPDFVQERLAALQEQLQRIPIKDAYEIAYRQGPQYVTDPKFLLMFLRAEEFDAAKAADRLVKFHEGIRKYFGVSVLGRSLTLSDLDKDDMACLKTGVLQRLMSRDSSGRAVLCELSNVMKTFYKHADNVVRAIFAKKRRAFPPMNLMHCAFALCTDPSQHILPSDVDSE